MNSFELALLCAVLGAGIIIFARYSIKKEPKSSYPSTFYPFEFFPLVVVGGLLWSAAIFFSALMINYQVPLVIVIIFSVILGSTLALRCSSFGRN